HTIAVGGNILGASEAGISVARIKYANFMLTGFFGALVGLMVTFQTSSIDPSKAGYQTMFYAIAGAGIGGTALARGDGTRNGAGRRVRHGHRRLPRRAHAVDPAGRLQPDRDQCQPAADHLRRRDPGCHDRQRAAGQAAEGREDAMNTPAPDGAGQSAALPDSS